MGVVLPNPVFGINSLGEMSVLEQSRKDLTMGPQFSIHTALGRGLTPMPIATAQNTAPADAGYSGPFANQSLLGEPAAVWVGALALLGFLAYYSSRPSTLGGANPAHIKIGGYNFLAVGLTAAVFFVLAKAIFNRFPIPGVTEFVNAL